MHFRLATNDKEKQSEATEKGKIYKQRPKENYSDQREKWRNSGEIIHKRMISFAATFIFFGLCRATKTLNFENFE